MTQTCSEDDWLRPPKDNTTDKCTIHKPKVAEKVYPDRCGSSDEDMMEVKKFTIVEHWSCERRVTVKAVDKDHAEERAEEVLLNVKPEMTHKMHTEVDERGVVEEVPRKKIETGEYYEEGGGGLVVIDGGILTTTVFNQPDYGAGIVFAGFVIVLLSIGYDGGGGQ